MLVDGREELACRYRVKGDAAVVLPGATASEMEATALAETAAEVEAEALERIGQGSNDAVNTAENTCYALDIGTTTLALALVDIDSGRILRTVSRGNPQRRRGDDVISRIEYCRRGGAGELCAVLRDAINGMIASLGLGGERELFASGNTVMLHLLLGADCSGMGAFPYTPSFTASQRRTGEELGLFGVSEAVTLPCISAFVGADITAGIACMASPPPGRYAMLVDLGTNAEIALLSARGTVCTSAAAGPCFEGASISCGMSAAPGAICSFSIGRDGEAVYRTVGGGEPVGICGTGLIDAVAELIRVGAVDSSGALRGGGYRIAPDVLLTQEDIRELQLAKSAVRSAIETLLYREHVSESDVSEVCVSGGFATELDLKSAVKLGLIPYKLAARCRAVANTSLAGAAIYACRFHGGGSAAMSGGRCEYTDLSSDAYFSKRFIENMSF